MVGASCRIDHPFTFEDGSRAAVARTTADWLLVTPSRRIIAVDAKPQFDNAAIGLTLNQQQGQFDALSAQNRFRLVETVRVP